MTRLKNLYYKNQKTFVVITFLFIPIILLLLFSYYPAIKLIQLSFTNWDGISKLNYIGIDNFKNLFTNSDNYMPLLNNIAYIIVMVTYTFLAAYFSIILDSKIRAKNFFKSIIFLPYIINGVAVALIFNFLFDFEYGPLNIILGYIGVNGVHWIGEGYLTNFSLAFIGAWKYMGFIMVGFLGALQSISPSFYEAADIDGATFFQKVRFITVPSIKRTFELYFFLGINGALQVFEQVYIITQGGPGNKTETIMVSIWKTAFTFADYGAASARAVFLVIIILILIFIQRKFMKSGEVD